MDKGQQACPGGGLIPILLHYASLYRLLEFEVARELGLRITDLRCLQEFCVSRLVSIKQLTRRLGVTGSRVSRILDRLEQRKLLKREIDVQDRRNIQVHLTARGERLRASLMEKLSQAHVAEDTTITEQQAAIAERILRGVFCGLARRIGGLEDGTSGSRETGWPS